MTELVIEADVKEFIRRLPDISYEPLSTHLLMLITRRRFADPQLAERIKDTVVERKIIKPDHHWREFYFREVYNLATLARHGLYVQKNKRLPPKCFGVCGTIVPRNVSSALGGLLREIDQQLLGILNQGHPPPQMESEEHRVPSQRIYLSQLDRKLFGRLHAHKYNKLLRAITVDVDDPTIFTEVRDMVSPFDVWMVTRTSRGYHIILDLRDHQTGREFYAESGAWKSIHRKFGRPKKDPQRVEVQRDPQEPIPGTRYYSETRENNFVEIIE